MIYNFTEEHIPYTQRQSEMFLALKTEVKVVLYEEHTMYNGFVYSELDRTISAIPEEYMPIGFCYRPGEELGVEKRVGFVLEARDGSDTLWVHIHKVVFEHWLRQANIPLEPYAYIWEQYGY